MVSLFTKDTMEPFCGESVGDNHNKDLEEEYIDLVPILQKMYFDADEFLKPIEGVQITNG